MRVASLREDVLGGRAQGSRNERKREGRRWKEEAEQEGSLLLLQVVERVQVPRDGVGEGKDVGEGEGEAGVGGPVAAAAHVARAAAADDKPLAFASAVEREAVGQEHRTRCIQPRGASIPPGRQCCMYGMRVPGGKGG